MIRRLIASLAVMVALALACPAQSIGSLQDHFSGTKTITTTVGSAAIWEIHSASSCFVNVTGTWTGTLSFFGSNGGTTNGALDIYIIEGFGEVYRAQYPSTVTNGNWQFVVAGLKYVTVTGPTSTGSATVNWSCGPGMAAMYVSATPSSIQNVAITLADATVTQSSSTPAIYLQGQKQLDYFIIWVGITGSPSGCTVTFKGTGDTVNYIGVAAGSVAITPATTGAVAGSLTTVPLGVGVTATYACSSTYPTAGTITVELVVK